MARKRETPLFGISEFGRVISGVDTSYGHTEPEGFEIGENLTRYDIRSGITGAVRKSVPQQIDPEFTVRLQDVDLANIAESKGLPASALTGDLNGTTPTAEVLKVFAGEIGTEEGEFYAIGPGPKGPRRVSIPRAVVKSTPRLRMGRNGHSVLEITYQILEAAGRELYEIEDAL
ncbi:MAG: hypothetical protein AB1941_01905 [Gemmatimonadota bacterium]